MGNQTITIIIKVATRTSGAIVINDKTMVAVSMATAGFVASADIWLMPVAVVKIKGKLNVSTLLMMMMMRKRSASLQL